MHVHARSTPGAPYWQRLANVETVLMKRVFPCTSSLCNGRKVPHPEEPRVTPCRELTSARAPREG